VASHRSCIFARPHLRDFHGSCSPFRQHAAAVFHRQSSACDVRPADLGHGVGDDGRSVSDQSRVAATVSRPGGTRGLLPAAAAARLSGIIMIISFVALLEVWGVKRDRVVSIAARSAVVCFPRSWPSRLRQRRQRRSGNNVDRSLPAPGCSVLPSASVAEIGAERHHRSVPVCRGGGDVVTVARCCKSSTHEVEKPAAAEAPTLVVRKVPSGSRSRCRLFDPRSSRRFLAWLRRR
jgi:hypothetical protein